MRSTNIFGDRDWNDVRRVVAHRLRKRFRRANQDDIDDAVSLAMVDLVDYWVQLDSSIISDNPDRTFWQACKRGTWMATTFLTQDWGRKETPTEAATEGTGEARGKSPEQVVLEQLDTERFTNFIESQLDSAGDWLRPFMSGVTTYEQAEVEGVARQSLSERWQRRLTSFQTAAHEAGFGPA